ncbi:MAG: SprB repeat-containing protein [Bacteroidetes bacterium]|nr:SprB repeat-containing protein [Bacteroidota bacterium]
MKKLKLFFTALIAMFTLISLAQPTIGVSPFTVSSTTIISAASTCGSGKTADIMDGWRIKISSLNTCGFNIANGSGSDGHINYIIGGFANLVYLSFGSTNGGEFEMKEAQLSTSTTSCTNVPMLYTGYKDNIAVPGATLIANMPSSVFPSTIAVTFTNVPAFQNVDNIEVTTSSYCAGNYQVWSLTTGTATPSPCPTPTLSLSGQTNVLCNGGSSGTATVSATGGPSFTYTWSPSGGNAVTASGLSTGIYTCIATNSCGLTASTTVNITQPTAISLNAASQTNISCFGGSNGATSVNAATGGAGGYSYNWTPGNPTGDGTTSVTGLTAGSWACTVTDGNGCTKTTNFTVTQPTALNLNAASQTNISCFGGSNGAASVNAATGGSAAYSYNWTPGNPTGDGTTSVTGLTAGSWTCTVTDGNGCTKTANFTITQPTALVATLASQTNISCNGGSNGAASINTPSGGAGGYTYNWTPGNPTGDGTTSVTGLYTYSWAPSGGTAATATGLSQGNYTVTVTDANSCTKTAFANITQPTALATSTSVTNVACNGGSNGVASVTASGGAGGYTYSWAPGGGTAATATGLSQGNYTVTVTDANSCTKTAFANITQPTALATSTSVTNVSCNGGSNGVASVTASMIMVV